MPPPAALLLPALLLAGCGQAGPASSTSQAPGAPGGDGGAATRITIVADPDGTRGPAEPTLTRLTCNPTGGTHPDPVAACAQLAEAGPAAFDRVPADATCSPLSGDPRTATISGVAVGRDVDTAFTRTDSCQVNRWDALDVVLATAG